MSTKLLTDITSFHELQDDLESLYYVILYSALQYLPHDKVPILPTIMMYVYGQHYTIPTGVFGGNGKDSMVQSRGHI